MRAFTLLITTICAGLPLAGCSSSSTSPSATSGAAKADAALAARIADHAKKFRAQSNALNVEHTISDLNAKGGPVTESEGNGGASPSTPTSPQVAPSAVNTGSAGASTALLTSGDKRSFAALASRLGGSSGIAVTRLGPGGRIIVTGALRSGVAWSTMKMGVAAATFAAGQPDASTQALLTRAMTASDNAAAEQLWAKLGPPSTAGQKVTAQLRLMGDQATQVQTQVTRAGFTSFGQSVWSLKDQVRFTSALPCTSQGRSLLGLMGQVVSGQRWGLGSAGVQAQFKGGWGPGTSGGYLVRQTGILTVQGRPIAVSIGTLPPDGSFDTGTRNLTQIASWFVSHVNASRAPKKVTC